MTHRSLLIVLLSNDSSYHIVFSSLKMVYADLSHLIARLNSFMGYLVELLAAQVVELTFGLLPWIIWVDLISYAVLMENGFNYCFIELHLLLIMSALYLSGEIKILHVTYQFFVTFGRVKWYYQHSQYTLALEYLHQKKIRKSWVLDIHQV